MAKQKDTFTDIARKAPAELAKMLVEAKERMWNLRIDLAAGKVKNVREMHLVRQTIARVLTTMNKGKTNE